MEEVNLKVFKLWKEENKGLGTSAESELRLRINQVNRKKKKKKKKDAHIVDMWYICVCAHVWLFINYLAHSCPKKGSFFSDILLLEMWFCY